MENTRIKINIKTGEIEFEGSEDFVQKQMDNLGAVINLLSLKNTLIPTENVNHLKPSTQEAPDTPETHEATNMVSGELDVPESFGEWMHKFKDTLTELEKALITAYFVQSQSSSNEFKTLEVNKSLKDHGIKLSNPSRILKNLETKKYLFQTRKEGPKIRFMRVSQDGLINLKSLLR